MLGPAHLGGHWALELEPEAALERPLISYWVAYNPQNALDCCQGKPQSIEIRVVPHGGICRRCSRCQRPAPGYDCLPERRWLFVPLWGIPTYFCYAPRRVECAEHGVVVEHIPWSDGKRPVTCTMMGFLARWARRLSWLETARAFQTSWEPASSPGDGGSARTPAQKAFPEIAVMKFAGDCRPRISGEVLNDEKFTLASTIVSGGRVLPVSRIGCEQVKKSMASIGRGHSDKMLGRALGRVVSHELYHILARTTAHSAKGLAKAIHSPFELISAQEFRR